MLHAYEIRRINNNGETHIISWFTAEPKIAKQNFKKFAEENPGAYSLYQVQRVASRFTVKGFTVKEG